jgi:quercetin dioxygenase-like cupin family protein
VRLFRLNLEGRAIEHFGSEFVHFRIAECGAAHISRLRLEPSGRVGRHAASSQQLFIVVEGGGFVCGGEGEEQSVSAGDAALWELGEEHEARTDDGMTAIVLEGERFAVLAPERR